MGRIRNCIIDVIRTHREITAKDLKKKVAERFPDLNPDSVRGNLSRELNKLVEDGFILRDGDRLKWAGKEIPQPQPQPQPPAAKDVCPNCGDNLDGKLWHRCRDPRPPFTKHTKVIVLVKWDGEWLPVSQRFRRGWGTDWKGVLSCEWCGFEFVDLWFGVIHPAYTLFPVRCPQCGKRFLAMVDLATTGIVR